MGLAELDTFLAGKGAAAAGAAPAAAPPKEGAGYVDRLLTRGADRAKEIAGFPVRVGRLVAGVDKPQSFEDTALLALGNAPLIATGGGALGAALPMLPKLAPALGRIASSVGLAKGRGEDNMTAALEGVGAVVGEGAMGLANKALATPARALELIRERLGVGQGGPLNQQLFDSLVSWWQGAPNPAQQAQRAVRVVANLKAMEPSGEMARVFREQVAKGMKILGRATPPASPSLAAAAKAVVDEPLVRGGVDAALSADKKPGAAAVMGASTLNPLRAAARLLQ